MVEEAVRYTFNSGGLYGGRTYAEAQVLKQLWPAKCLIFNYRQMDALIACGVQPSQLHLEGEIHTSEFKIIRKNLMDEIDMSYRGGRAEKTHV